ncbi:RluA family pseudouridine synthase [Parvularcula sp. ZS-1/3]|uniref:Pseudouridine synthase n=1 Tax=Parvularcula mediterranea TaxID=2732508 RepID=A0A7Y3RNA6_9PROT|nr:RluA family pseudouridine synthase [Parvularcula mediterranea]NNU17219.1 RluA family pseudouridine synthase [Parvularcula mediterranea]
MTALEGTGERIDRWLAERTDYSRTQVKNLIKEGALTLSGEAMTDPTHKIAEGDEIALVPPPVKDADPEAEDIPLDVLFEDEHLIALNKPAGLVVHPAAGNWSGTLVNALLHHCKDSLSGIGGVARPGIVHRLDKDTSGVMVVAKNDEAHRGLRRLFSVHDIERSYLALIHADPRPASGTIDIPIARSKSNRLKRELDMNFSRPDAREAVTHYKRLEAYGEGRGKVAGEPVASLVQCTLETGRTHQIRVHLSGTGHPLIGDRLYGKSGVAGLQGADDITVAAREAVRSFSRQALHAAILGFEHPVTGDDLRFESEPPQDFQDLRAALRAL